MRASSIVSVTFLSLCLALSPLVAIGCGGAPPPSAPDSPEIEAQARVAYDRARSDDDPQKLLDVYQRFSKSPSGRKALFLGADRLAARAEKLARKCKDEEARSILSTIAGYVTDESAMDSKVDALKEKIEKHKRKCTLDALDDRLETAEKAWNWPKVFAVIDDDDLAKQLDSKTIGRKRDELHKRWIAAIDRTLAEIVKRRSSALVIDEHRKGWLASIDEQAYPEDLRDEIAARRAKIAGVMLVFDHLEGGSLVDPPSRYWTFGETKVRLASAPEKEGKTLPQGLPFMVVAQGKLGDQNMLVVGKPDGDELQRLSTIEFLVPEKHAKSWDTRMLLPTDLAGARVLAPASPGSKELAAFDVAEEKGDLVFATPPGKTARARFKKSELRAFYLPAGTAVRVRVGWAWKTGETSTEAVDGDTIGVQVNGEALQAPIGDVHVQRAALPRIPND